MSKGDGTRTSILNLALDLSSKVGLEGLTFGVLAKTIKMSKSGLYAHFDSKETLQRDVLDVAAKRFVDVVVRPAIREPRGVPRIEKLYENWLRWGSGELSGGCPFVAAAAEFDDREGPVRDCLKGHLRNMLGAIARAAKIAVAEGHFRADLDAEQFAYEFWATVVAHQHYQRLLSDSEAGARSARSFRSLVDRSRA
jgi:AcrR family transcriptional regulator